MEDSTFFPEYTKRRSPYYYSSLESLENEKEKTHLQRLITLIKFLFFLLVGGTIIFALFWFGVKGEPVPDIVDQTFNNIELLTCNKYIGNIDIMLPAALNSSEDVCVLEIDTQQIENNPPSDISKLVHLKKLTLSGGLGPIIVGKMNELPPGIERLKELRILNLRNNSMRWLPPEIGQLTLLEELDLGSNYFSSLPWEIGFLTNLKALRLDHNLLKEIPSRVYDLTNLKELTLQGNNLDNKEVEKARQLLPKTKIIF